MGYEDQYKQPILNMTWAGMCCRGIRRDHHASLAAACAEKSIYSISRLSCEDVVKQPEGIEELIAARHAFREGHWRTVVEFRGAGRAPHVLSMPRESNLRHFKECFTPGARCMWARGHVALTCTAAISCSQPCRANVTPVRLAPLTKWNFHFPAL